MSGRSHIYGEYDKDKKELEIHFKDGTMSTYLNVPEHVAKAFEEAPSAGRFFNALIRDHYSYK